MNTQKTREFVWGILGNIVASLLIALANILIGKFLVEKVPGEVIDILSLMLPMLLIFLFLVHGHLREIHLDARMLSIAIATLVTILLIVGFGVSIRWLFEGRIERAIPPIYDMYRQIYGAPSP